MMHRAIISILLLGVPTFADTFEGKVTAVLEGDTVQIRDTTGKQSIFRLLGADAPEKRQTFFPESKQALQSHVKGQSVTVDWTRAQICPPSGGSCAQLAKVLFRGEDLGLRQISRGFAWHDKRLKREQSTADKALYREAEVNARQKRRGIWKGKNPVPPWEFVFRDIPTASTSKKKRKPTSIPRRKSR